jgi:ATP-dependent protease ClpP protease subunit
MPRRLPLPENFTFQMKKERISLYGFIEPSGENSAAAFMQRLNAAAAKADEIELHVHSGGGDVFEGNIIYNAIAHSRKPVDVYVDGLAASMASVIMLAGRKVYMAKNAFVMIHSPRTFTSGVADDLEREAALLRSLEAQFIEVYSAKTGKKAEDAAEWLKGDNWFNAAEALAEKLIDGITESTGINPKVPEKELKKTAAAALPGKLAAMYAPIINYKNFNSEMDKQTIIARYGLAGVTAESSDADIYAALDRKTQDEKAAKEAAVAALAAEKEKRITAKVDAAIAAKKITALQKEQFIAIGKGAGAEALQTALDAIRTAPSITSQIAGGGGEKTPPNRADWDWDRWQKEDAAGLEVLAKAEPDTFKALYKKKYGVEIN